ncbi:hypothetical protein PYX07_04450 [Pseudomonas aeruginosa]|nr:hypothetical protein [Pseudomonas aeruginosa]
MFLKEQARLSELNGTQGYRHDATPFFVKNFNHAGAGARVNRKANLLSIAPLVALADGEMAVDRAFQSIAKAAKARPGKVFNLVQQIFYRLRCTKN